MSVPSWAVPGAKVVCVDADSPAKGVRSREGRGWGVGENPVEGQVYIVSSAWLDREGIAVAEFFGLVRSNESCRQWDEHLGYGLWRFRPLVTRSQEQDIAEHFSHHRDQRVPEKA